MAASFPIITGRVEEKTGKGTTEVKRIQQLLVRTGHHQRHGVNGVWGKDSITAWVAYQQGKGWNPNEYVEPMDTEDRLLWLALDAGVLMWLQTGLRSLSAVTSATETSIAEAIPYGWTGHGGTKMAWGFENRPWAVIFTKPGSQKTATFDIDSSDPRALNCCSFANLLLSLWVRGDCHGSPYSSGQAVGGDGPQIGERYGLKEVLNKHGGKGIGSLAELKAALQPSRIYHMALCRDAEGDFTKHDTILINGEVYQANVPNASPNPGAVYKRTIDEVWGKIKVKRVRLLGPGPY